MGTAQYTFNTAPTMRRMAKILELLRASPDGLSRIALASATALSHRAMKAYLAALRGDKEGFERQIRVTRWRRQRGTGGNFEAIFVIGTAPDAKKPKADTPATVVRRYRQRLKRERIEAYEDQLTRLRRRRALARPAQRDRVAIAMFGAAGVNLAFTTGDKDFLNSRDADRRFWPVGYGDGVRETSDAPQQQGNGGSDAG